MHKYLQFPDFTDYFVYLSSFFSWKYQQQKNLRQKGRLRPHLYQPLNFSKLLILPLYIRFSIFLNPSIPLCVGWSEPSSPSCHSFYLYFSLSLTLFLSFTSPSSSSQDRSSVLVQFLTTGTIATASHKEKALKTAEEAVLPFSGVLLWPHPFHQQDKPHRSKYYIYIHFSYLKKSQVSWPLLYFIDNSIFSKHMYYYLSIYLSMGKRGGGYTISKRLWTFFQWCLCLPLNACVCVLIKCIHTCTHTRVHSDIHIHR